MRTLTAFKHGLPEPVACRMRHDHRAVFYRINDLGEAKTPADGVMKIVRLQLQADLADPNADIAALIGLVDLHRASGAEDPNSPELWYWQDKFWVKAKNSDGLPYYHKKAYLLYEVILADSKGVMASLDTGFE